MFDLSGIGPPDGGRCAPGQTQQCLCLGGGMGTQTCRASGSSYGACTGCGDAPDGPVTVVQDGGASACGNCAGCCDGATCIPFASQTNAKCGTTGQACASCGTNVCDSSSGKCVVSAGTCNSTNCASGCCKNAGSPAKLTCFASDPDNCGTGGGMCNSCNGTTCSNGACTNMIDGDHYFKLVVSKVSVYNTVSDGGSCWDWPGCGQPDVKVCFGYLVGSTLIEGCALEKDNVPKTSTYNGQDVDDVTWSGTDGVIMQGGSPLLFPGQAFIDGHRVRVTVTDVDQPYSADESIGQAYINAQSTYSTAYTLGAFQRVLSVTFSLQ